MCFDVIHQIARLRERLATGGAGILLLPHVNFFMCPQASALGKSLFALRAVLGLLSCVDSTVNCVLTGRRTLYTWNMRKESLQYRFFSVSSGSWIWGKICHK